MTNKHAKKSPAKPEGHKWKKLPKGWTDESRKKFWDSLTSRAPKHKVSQCIKRMEGKVDNPGAFCASLADRVIPGWREEAAKDRRKKKASGLLRQAASALSQPLRTRRDYGEEDSELGEKPHSQIPGTDSLPMEMDRKVASQWISREEMKTLCPPCAERMKKGGISKVHVEAVRKVIAEQLK